MEQKNQYHWKRWTFLKQLSQQFVTFESCLVANMRLQTQAVARVGKVKKIVTVLK